jgi:hypothetical protein
MKLYPYTQPIIMNDSIFVAYGGQTGTSTPAQRQASYLMAEELVTDSIGTFLLPTTVTGTFAVNDASWWSNKRYLVTDYGYVNSVLSTSLLSYNGNHQNTLGSSLSGFLIRNDSYGYLDLGWFNSMCGCPTSGYPYQFQIAYVAGLPTGTANNPKILEALTIVTQIDMNEKIFPYANEGVGDIGIQSFSNIGYSEHRRPLMNTTFGDSPRAVRAHRLLNSIRKIPARML